MHASAHAPLFGFAPRRSDGCGGGGGGHAPCVTICKKSLLSSGRGKRDVGPFSWRRYGCLAHAACGAATLHAALGPRSRTRCLRLREAQIGQESAAPPGPALPVRGVGAPRRVRHPVSLILTFEAMTSYAGCCKSEAEGEAEAGGGAQPSAARTRARSSGG